jgi:predicted AlkP superfamily pyrophosphatase or phosphodiesterase
MQHYGLKSASVFWPGSEAWIGGMRPNRVFPYDGAVGNAERIGRVIELARLPKKERPHLITAYLSSLDELGHAHGPESEQVQCRLHQY